MNNKPHQYSSDEVQELFLEHVWHMIDYWNTEARTPDTREKLSGLAHSLLAAIDGSSTALPGFKLCPSPHPSDKAYHQNNGQNWFPTKVDIGGDLAYQLFRVEERMKAKKNLTIPE